MGQLCRTYPAAPSERCRADLSGRALPPVLPCCSRVHSIGRLGGLCHSLWLGQTFGPCDRRAADHACRRSSTIDYSVHSGSTWPTNRFWTNYGPLWGLMLTHTRNNRLPKRKRSGRYEPLEAVTIPSGSRSASRWAVIRRSSVRPSNAMSPRRVFGRLL